jgi:putative ABC transport system substrate-binding protein
MRRREFMTLIGGAAAIPALLWPLAAGAQQPALPVIGFLGSASAAPIAHFMAAFRQGLGESGYAEGRNVAIEYRWADNQYERLPALAAELVRRQVNVIVASGGPVAAMAAKAATSTIPIVFTASSDPVKLGLVASLNRPGGNVTGSGMFTAELEPKRLELLRELVPTARVIGALVNPGRTDAEAQSRDVQAAGRTLGLEVIILPASSAPDIDTAFAGLAGRGVAALVIGADPFFLARREQLVALAARHAVPAVYMNREFPAGGGLASYGANIAEGYRQAGIYAGRILKGEKPADLPVVRPTKLELVINLKTAKALGLDVPLSIQQRADEVIE